MIRTGTIDKKTTVLAVLLTSLGRCLGSQPSHGSFFAGLLIAGLILPVMFRKGPSATSDRRTKLIVILVSATTFACVTGPKGIVWPSLLYFLLTVAFFSRKRAAYARHVESTLYRLLIIASLLVVTEAAYEWVLWFSYDSALFDQMLSPVLSFFGVTNTVVKQGIAVFDGRNTEIIHYGIERIHAVDIVRLVIVYTLCLYLFGGCRIDRRQLILVAGRGCVLSLVWILGSFVIWNYTKQPHVFISRPLCLLMDVAGMALLLPFCRRSFRVPADRIHIEYGTVSPLRLCAQVLVCLLVVFCTYFPIGQKKEKNRVLVDDYYSAWEVSDSPFAFTDESMTKKSAYSYTNFVEYIRNYYPIDINKDKRFDQRDLGKYSVILMKTNTKPFSQKEIQCLVDFVDQGGGLFVHGDHTNLFGMSEHFNALLKHFKIEFNMDDEADHKGSPNLYERVLRSGVHPTLLNVDRFQFLTSCTLRTSNWLVEPVLTSRDIFSEDADYGRPGFFGNMRLDARDRVGCFLQAAIVPFGRGRIAVFSDSTVYSNFAAFQSDYIDFAVDTLEYLQHTNTPTRKNVLWAMAALTALSVILGARSTLRRSSPNLLGMLSFDIGMGCAIGLVVSLVLASSNRVIAKPMRPIPEIAVVLGNAGNADILSATYKSDADKLNDFGSFMMCLQRYGYFPRLYATLTEATRKADDVVLVNPNVRWASKVLEQLQHRLMRRKMRLLVVDSISNGESTANELLSRFGIQIGVRATASHAKRLVSLPNYSRENDNLLFTLIETGAYLTCGGATVAEINPPVVQDLVMPTLQGGEPVFADVHQNVTCARKRFHNGSLVMAYVDSVNLSMQALGGGFMRNLSDEEKDRIRSVQRLLTEFGKP